MIHTSYPLPAALGGPGGRAASGTAPEELPPPDKTEYTQKYPMFCVLGMKKL